MGLIYKRFYGLHAGDRVTIHNLLVPAYTLLMTPENYEKYPDSDSVWYGSKQLSRSNTLRVPFDGDWVAVADAGKNEISQGKADVEDVKPSDFNSTKRQEVIVHHAENTSELDDRDMTDYWEEQKGITIKDGFICPSCHHAVKRDELNGAHVELTYDGDKKLYIIPTCQSCNKGGKKENFVVASEDLVLAPLQRGEEK